MHLYQIMLFVFFGGVCVYVIWVITIFLLLCLLFSGCQLLASWLVEERCCSVRTQRTASTSQSTGMERTHYTSESSSEFFNIIFTPFYPNLIMCQFSSLGNSPLAHDSYHPGTVRATLCFLWEMCAMWNQQERIGRKVLTALFQLYELTDAHD